MANQVAQFSAGCTGCFDAATSLFVVWAFPNDVFSNAAFGLTPPALIAQGVGNIVSAIQSLAAEGAMHFLIPNMANLGATPAFLGNGSLTALTLGFNAALAGALTALDQVLAAEITQFDTFGALNDLIQNPAGYGLTNVTDQCVQHLVDGLCNPNTWLYWDSVHPTTAAHAILGARLAAAVPEPGSMLLIATALLLLGTRRRLAQLTLARHGKRVRLIFAPHAESPRIQ